MTALLQDVRCALRMLRNNLGFTTVAVLTLALGIGANTAIFQMLDAIRLTALPLKNPDQLAQVRIIQPHGRTGNFTSSHPDLTYPQWEQIRALQQGFSGGFAWSEGRFNIAPSGETRYVDGLYVSGDFFRVLGVQAIAGRLLTPQDDQRGCGSPGVVLSEAFWKREYGGKAFAVGRTMTIEHASHYYRDRISALLLCCLSHNPRSGLVHVLVAGVGVELAHHLLARIVRGRHDWFKWMMADRAASGDYTSVFVASGNQLALSHDRSLRRPLWRSGPVDFKLHHKPEIRLERCDL